jgi:NADH-quinone oxidoreductase subunit C
MTQAIKGASHVGGWSEVHPEVLRDTLVQVLGDRVSSVSLVREEVTVEVPAARYLEVMQLLQTSPGCQFEQLVDICGMDYSAYRDGAWEGARFAVVAHLLSVSLNQRVRVRVFCPEDDFPVVDSVSRLWSSANWYEREAFDLYGIVFDGHDDLRRILTDYGFIGHPFRKDFPVSGHVEMRYDPERRRVVYEPVTIEPREITPRIIREDNYGGLH